MNRRMDVVQARVGEFMSVKRCIGSRTQVGRSSITEDAPTGDEGHIILSYFEQNLPISIYITLLQRILNTFTWYGRERLGKRLGTTNSFSPLSPAV